MQINEIIKKTIARLRAEDKILTPNFYTEAFCKEAKKAGVIVEDCSIERFLNLLDKKYQQEIKAYNISSTNELMRYVISSLNRTNPSEASGRLKAYEALFRTVLKSIDALHNKKASSLAYSSLDIIKNGASISQIESLVSLWIDFITSYDDTFLDVLKPQTSYDKTDLEKTLKSFSSDQKGEDLSRVAKMLSISLTPSIASAINDDLADLSSKIKNSAQYLTSSAMEDDVMKAIKLRILLDKNSLKEMILNIDKLIENLSHQLADLIEESDSSNIEIKKVKSALEAYDLTKEVDFKSAHKKLYVIATSLEKKTSELSSNLKKRNGEVIELSGKISKLEDELKKTQELSREDFLTKLYNKRALDEFLHQRDAEFERYAKTYSLVMFDLDHFKDVNDTYGHESGDAVLKGFAKIIKNTSREVDIVGRYGGEEFLVLLTHTELKGGIIFANKVRQKVKKTKFMYKNQRIKVSVSGGVAQRSNFSSLKETLKKADDRLYEAKNSGRDKIVP